jgi:general secretion pathway protein A
MYLSHFGLRERPFSNTPDPRFVYLGARHEEALAHLLYGVQEHGGFVQLTGEIGTGKTTVCRLLLERLPNGVEAALILNPVLTPEELLATLCDELDVKYDAHEPTRKTLVDALYRHLLAAHAATRRIVLIVDEAQNLTVEALEQLRLLTNLETDKQKLLQIILIGQPELTQLLGRRDLRQLAQRITARYHLLPFAEAEAGSYVRHRLALAGGARDIIEARAMREVYRHSGGVPRLINVICDRALLGAYAQRRAKVDARTVRAAAREVLGARALLPSSSVRWPLAAAGACLLAVAGIAAAGLGGALPDFRAALPAIRPLVAMVAERIGNRDRPASPAAAVAADQPGPIATATPAPRQPALAELLKSAEAPADRESAFANLFARWKVDPLGWSNPCEAATSFGLECVAATGGWPQLRRLDLPAVLRLATPDGGQHWAALLALDAAKATIAVGARVVVPPVDELESLWDGRFELLWQPPPIGASEVTPGSRGKAVVWLRQRLDAVEGTPAAVRGDFYDDGLRARVLAFQQHQSLGADGIAGVETLARLGSLVDLRIPSLSRGGK